MKPTSAALLVLADPAYPRLKEHLIASTGLAYYADKDADLAGRVALRLAQTGVGDCTAYLARLTGDGGAEHDALIEDLTIGETFFFRHQEMFDALRATVLPDLLERNRAGRHLRIWSAGCATGAEAYSVALLLQREFARQIAGWDVRIVGTDVNRAFLTRARAGVFDEWAFRATPDALRGAAFESEGRTWTLKPEYRAGVTFQYHNLVTDHFPSHVNNLFAFDLILCRNVTIYFHPDIVRRIIGHLHESLVEGGWLLVGPAEPNAEFYKEFRVVNVVGAVLYQKADPASPARPLAPAPAWAPPVLDLEEPAPPAPPAPPPAPDVAGEEDVVAIRALANRGTWTEAARLCEDVLQRDRLNPVIYFYQALVLEQLARHLEAEHALRRALYLDRGFVLAHYYVGLLHQKQGDPARAARAFRNVLELLARTDEAHVFPEGDGITAAELGKLTRMHLDLLEGA